MTSSTLRRKFVLSLLLGVLVFGGLAAYGDFPKLVTHLEDFRWELLPLILLVTSGNYLLRFLKWQYYLKQIGVRGLAKLDSFLIYFSGMGMTVTPGKAGEWLKVHLLNEMHGTSVTKSTPILLAERLTDALGLLIIAAAGVVVFGRNPLIIGTVVTFAGGGVFTIAVLRHRRLSHWLLARLARVPLIGRLEPHFEEFYEGTYAVMRPTGIVLMTALSVASWFFEVAAFYLTLIGVGVDGSFDTLFKAAFILPIATLVAALLPTPGGLGIAEAGITSLSLRLFKDMTKSTAAVSTLIVRLATLWFGVALGLLMFAVLSRRLARRGITLDAAAPEQPPALAET